MSGLELVAGIAGVAAAAIKVSVSMNDLAENLGRQAAMSDTSGMTWLGLRKYVFMFSYQKLVGEIR
jgi:hypothetical protein